MTIFTDLGTESAFTLPTFTLFSQAGGYVLSAHVLAERVEQKVKEWERAGEIVRVAPDLPHPGDDGDGEQVITIECGLCRLTFDLMYPPDQYPSVLGDMGEPEDLICDACQDLMEAGEDEDEDEAILAAIAIPGPAERDGALREAVARSNLATLRASLLAAGWIAESPAVLDEEGERLAREERWT